MPQSTKTKKRKGYRASLGLRQVTKKEKIFADTLVETGDKKLATLKGYPSVSYANINKLAYEVSHRPRVRAYIDWKCQQLQTTDKSLELLDSKLKATKPFATSDGKLMWIDDHSTQVKVAETLLKLAGAFDPEPVVTEQRSVSLSFNEESPYVIEYIARTGRYPTVDNYQILTEGTVKERRKLLNSLDLAQSQNT